MRSVRIALRATGVAVTLTALSAVAAPTALAGEENRGTVWATPSKARPGAQVELRVRGCHGTTGSAKSSAFVADADLSGRDGHGKPLYGEAMISSYARPGWHDIRVTCDGREGKATGSLEVIRHGPDHHRPDHHRPDHDRPDHHRPSHHPSPVWPVHAGGGGMAAELAETSRPAAATDKDHGRDGPSMPHTLIGAVLAAAATLAVAGRALTLRRRRSGE
ncbi:hypothetical protein ABZX75_28040 [Streptomyces sp. NPDC003038]|uniref:hypothetical protein n=1 Tax=unclassified Streptomyces TaxID=2593676 RepID=UPI0033A99C64